MDLRLGFFLIKCRCHWPIFNVRRRSLSGVGYLTRAVFRDRHQWSAFQPVGQGGSKRSPVMTSHVRTLTQCRRRSTTIANPEVWASAVLWASSVMTIRSLRLGKMGFDPGDDLFHFPRLSAHISKDCGCMIRLRLPSFLTAAQVSDCVGQSADRKPTEERLFAVGSGAHPYATGTIGPNPVVGH